jgi:hypothetical protein
MSDVNLSLKLDTDVAECGDVVAGMVRWGRLESAPRGVRIELRYWTEGRGDSDGGVVAEVELDGAVQGAGRFELLVPEAGPMSFEGKLIRVMWAIELIIDKRLRPDPDISHPITVLPRGGLAMWARQAATPPTVSDQTPPDQTGPDQTR